MEQKYDVIGMKSMLKNHGVVVACTRPNWEAKKADGAVLATGKRMRDAVVEAFHKTLLEVLEEVSPNF